MKCCFGEASGVFSWDGLEFLTRAQLMPETKIESPAAPSVATTSLRMIAVAITFACLYFASSLVITLICGIFIAFILEPGVSAMERVRVPRWLGSLIMVLAALAVVYFILYLIYGRAAAFMSELPKYAERLKQIQVTIKNIRLSASSFFPTATPSDAQTVHVQQEESLLPYVWRGFASVYGFFIAVLFIPILVFFMLTSKHQMWVATMNLFPLERRQSVEVVINGISAMVRQYVVGNLLIALISAAVICSVFALLGLPNALLLGVLAAFLSMVPYLGVVMGALPPVLVALVTPEF